MFSATRTNSLHEDYQCDKSSLDKFRFCFFSHGALKYFKIFTTNWHLMEYEQLFSEPIPLQVLTFFLFDSTFGLRDSFYERKQRLGRRATFWFGFCFVGHSTGTSWIRKFRKKNSWNAQRPAD